MANPIQIFKDNWKQAKSLGEVNSNFCSLATVSPTGQASIRTLVLREVTEDSFVIFINNTSLKWVDLQHSNQFELLVFWPMLMQQYRVRGEYSEICEDVMRLHWAKKPYETKIIDHYYREYQSQSSPLESRKLLRSGMNELMNRYLLDADIPFPGNAKGVSIKASYIEVWHGCDADRLHQRQLYELSAAGWEKKDLVP